MRRFIAVLTFSLLFVAGKADTIGHNHVYLRDSLIKDTYEGDVIYITLKAGTYDATDTLRFERYFGCGGERHAPYYSLLFTDPRNGNTIYEDTTLHAPHFSIPIALLQQLDSSHPGMQAFTGWYRPSYARNERAGVRFMIILE